MKRSRLNRISAQRLLQMGAYLHRAQKFLWKHPYCQVFLAENEISEEVAIESGGIVWLEGREGAPTFIPLSTQVHHKSKRRGLDLLDDRFWLAVSAEAHARIESSKVWARARGYLQPF